MDSSTLAVPFAGRDGYCVRDFFEMQLPVMMAGGQDDEMAGSVNKVILIGNVGADPEIRRTQDGRPIANLRIATSETWRDRNSGERKEKTEWHTVVVFNEGLCKVVEQYVKKGAKLYIEGQLQTRKWQDQTGNDRYSTEIVLQGFNSTLTMLDGRGEGGGGGRSGGGDFGGGGDYGSSGGGSSSGYGGGYDQQSSSRGGSSRGGGQPSGGFSNDMDDDIPF
ncbi:Single-stranded DNA-binding protein controls activity of RecBCD nuclease [Agrobacterium tomkonis CFBP 6623]|uniref:Single-stranded DNA-binding protein n=3 Tax=Rhizobium/Agrobacterium group TaxID=227290 RepID=A0A1S7PDR1_9HYPH|nr:Single-stranded DNA-binding protein controls activity of RecBCD nuclease [Agrobacterium tomkonis CFBP 6623]